MLAKTYLFDKAFIPPPMRYTVGAQYAANTTTTGSGSVNSSNTKRVGRRNNTKHSRTVNNSSRNTNAATEHNINQQQFYQQNH